MNDTPMANRVHISFFGKRNAGKSSIVNEVVGQSLAIVSDKKGTTTDPVIKTMELLPIGPVVIIDTPGLDDEGELGKLRVNKSIQILDKTDIAVLVVDAYENISEEDINIVNLINEKNIPLIIVANKMDLVSNNSDVIMHMKEKLDKVDIDKEKTKFIGVSAKEHDRIKELKELIGSFNRIEEPGMLDGIVSKGDKVVLVVPIDSAAPKGRLILPQQMAIREVLDKQAMGVVVQVNQLEDALVQMKDKPKVVITDSQAFEEVSKIVPKDVNLTSFSILLARKKVKFNEVLEGVKTLDDIKDGDTILISEGCTHHRQCDDIGTVKLPRWISNYTNKQVNFEFTSGREFPRDLSKYRMVIHCGGCMLNTMEMQNRQSIASKNRIPMTNYGVVIAYMNGILDRSTEGINLCLSK